MSSYPAGARLFPLQRGSKIPHKGTRGHLDALPASEVEIFGNYGISLDEQWLLVDIDAPNDPIAVEWGARLPETWTQKTGRGSHRLYKVPAGFAGKNAHFPAGDLKVKGYLVGPGSEVDGKIYHVLDPREPVEAPQWLLELVGRDRPSQTVIAGELYVNERDSITIHENDNELYSIACGFRRRGFSEKAIYKFIKGICESGGVDQDVNRGLYGPKDYARLARGACKFDPDHSLREGLLDEKIVCGLDVPLVGPPFRWWIRGFVPRGELALLFGSGGCGKSTFASWLAAKVSKKEGRFLRLGVEEPFARFLARAVLSGADRGKIYDYPNATSFSLPKDIAKLKDIIVMSNLDVVYFDSIYSHFSSGDGDNAAERARKCLGPLAEIAQGTGCTIMAVFHEGKSGAYLGSTEMRNVPRYLLEASRRSGGPLQIRVDKTNIYDPGYCLHFMAQEQVFCDPQTGEVQTEELENGDTEKMMLKILEEPTQATNNREDAEIDTRAQDRDTRVRELVDAHPELSANQIFKQVGGRQQDVFALVKALRGCSQGDI